jgi:hypothetical protein
MGGCRKEPTIWEKTVLPFPENAVRRSPMSDQTRKKTAVEASKGGLDRANRIEKPTWLTGGQTTPQPTLLRKRIRVPNKKKAKPTIDVVSLLVQNEPQPKHKARRNWWKHGMSNKDTLEQ